MGSRQRSLLTSRWLPVFAYCAVILGLSSIPGRSLPAPSVVGIDKLVHACVYSVLGALITRALAGRAHQSRALIVCLAALFGATFGALDELYQATVPNRSPDVFDCVADFVGALAGAWLSSAILLRRRRQPGPKEEDDGDDSKLQGNPTDHR